MTLSTHSIFRDTVPGVPGGLYRLCTGAACCVDLTGHNDPFLAPWVLPDLVKTLATETAANHIEEMTVFVAETEAELLVRRRFAHLPINVMGVTSPSSVDSQLRATVRRQVRLSTVGQILVASSERDDPIRQERLRNYVTDIASAEGIRSTVIFPRAIMPGKNAIYVGQASYNA